MSSPDYMELIKYLATHYKPIPYSYKYARIPEGFIDTEWSLTDIRAMIIEALNLELVHVSVYFSRHEEDSDGKLVIYPEDLRLVSLTPKGHNLFIERICESD